VVKMANTSRGLRDGGVDGGGNLAHFMHKITFSLTAGVETRAGG